MARDILAEMYTIIVSLSRVWSFTNYLSSHNITK